MSTRQYADGIGRVDRGLYALFSRHADRPTHDRDRRRYRAAGLETGFDLFIARLYGFAWGVALGGALLALVVVVFVPSTVTGWLLGFLADGLPVVNRTAIPSVPRLYLGVVSACFAAVGLRWLALRAGRVYLGRLAVARRREIERTLPGAVRYLRVLASGCSDQREMLGRVADQEAYGETARSFRTALNKASLTGSLDEGLSMVARDTPSRDLLSPFRDQFQVAARAFVDALLPVTEEPSLHAEVPLQ